MAEPWQQNFNPLRHDLLCAAAAVASVGVFFYFLAVRRVAAWTAAGYAFIAGMAVTLAGEIPDRH